MSKMWQSKLLATCLPNGKRKQLNQGTKADFRKVIHAIEDKHDHDDDEILTIHTIEVNAIEDTQHSIHDTRDVAFPTLEKEAEKLIFNVK